MLAAVIFDMDGVIVDSEPINFAIEQEIFQDLGIRLTDAEHHSYVGLTDQAMWSSIKNIHGLTQSVPELLIRSREHYVQVLKTMTQFPALPGVIPLIDTIRAHRIPIALATSSPPEKVSRILRALAIEDRFQAVIDGDQVQNGKPAPDIFLKTAVQLDKSPEHCLVIEDSQAGVLAARAAGMSCVGFRNPNSGSQDLSAANAVIDSFGPLRFEHLQEIHREASCQR